MLRLFARFLAVAAACALLACSSNELIQPRKVLGQVYLMADNATDGKKAELDGQAKPVPVIENLRKDPSVVTARVTDWRTITLRGVANRAQPPKPAADQPAPPTSGLVEFAATAVGTGEFSLRSNNRPVDMKVDLGWNAALKKGKGSITVDVTIAGPAFCVLKGRFDFASDPKDPNEATLEVTGFRAFKMKNGGSSDTNGVVSGARCALKAGDYTLRWSVTAQAAGEGSAEINIHRAILSLHK